MTSRVYFLRVERELCFVVGEQKTVTLELLNGFAEIFGSELSKNTVYTFQPFTSISLFTWQGCKVKLTGKVIKEYIRSDSLLMISVNIHACLQERRILAEYESEKGPVSLVVGPHNSGKSSFCHFLLNYAARMGRKPLFVDLDVFRNKSSVPGTVSIFHIEKPSHITEGFSKQASSIHLFGYTHPRENTKLYCLLIKQLAKIVKSQIVKEKSDVYHSGVIIDSFHWVRKKGYVAILLAALHFKPNVVFVMNKKELYNTLKGQLPSSVKVVFVPKQKGIFCFNPEHENSIKANLIWHYFHGPVENPSINYKIDVKFPDIQIYSAAKYSNADLSKDDLSSVLVKDVEILKVSVRPDIVNSILGLSHADKLDENILITDVKCFIWVINVDMERNIATFLSPLPAPLPGKIFILSSVKFIKEKCTMLEKSNKMN